MRLFVVGGKLFPLGFLVVFLALDWLTFIHEAPAVNITPWNPPAGLYAALLLVAPRKGAALTFAALMLGDLLVRGAPGPLLVLTLANLAVLASYAGGTWLLRRIGFHAGLDRLSDVVRLVVVLPASALAAALAFAATYAGADLLPWDSLPAVVMQYWVGDVIAILTVTPFLLLHLHRTSWTGPRPSRAETVFQAVAVAAVLAVIFSALVPDPSKILYLLFPPIIWVAMRRGVGGATAATLAIQLGVIGGLGTLSENWHDLTYYQSVMAAVAGTGLLVGAVVSERWRLEMNLNQRQAELARVSRLSLIGEMASNLAHELNQPLFTTIGYTKASRQLLLRDGDHDEILDLMDRAVNEAERAAGVLSGIRRFLRQDGIPTQIELSRALDGILVLAGPNARCHGIVITVDLPVDLPLLWIDGVQLDQVLMNLLRNSVDALAVRPQSERHAEIVVSARHQGSMVTVSVADSGPGVPADKVGPLFDLFFTTKPSGMGLGLPICRSIVEAHGGRLWLAHNGAEGACFSFTVTCGEPCLNPLSSSSTMTPPSAIACR